jgi:hypothetical protein
VEVAHAAEAVVVAAVAADKDQGLVFVNSDP